MAFSARASTSASHRRHKKAERYCLRNSLCYIRLSCQALASISSDHRRCRVRVTRNSDAAPQGKRSIGSDRCSPMSVRMAGSLNGNSRKLASSFSLLQPPEKLTSGRPRGQPTPLVSRRGFVARTSVFTESVGRSTSLLVTHVNLHCSRVIASSYELVRASLTQLRVRIQGASGAFVASETNIPRAPRNRLSRFS
jgi:hypothetical protein